MQIDTSAVRLFDYSAFCLVKFERRTVEWGCRPDYKPSIILWKNIFTAEMVLRYFGGLFLFEHCRFKFVQ
ncbi:Uncharacterised protein [uncultured archaeon]|nr:Uncharacterised protein [uncultured archaeon]